MRIDGTCPISGLCALFGCEIPLFHAFGRLFVRVRVALDEHIDRWISGLRRRYDNGKYQGVSNKKAV